MEKICFRCGATFTVPKAWARRGDGKFCGRACYFAHQRENPHSAAGKADPAGPATARTCPQCGASFTVAASVRRQHCSRACLSASNTHAVQCIVCQGTFRRPNSKTSKRPTCSAACRKAREVHRNCARCGKSFLVTRPGHAHCSEECRRPPHTTDCPTCGKRFRYVPANGTRFCSRRCYRRHTGETTPERNVRLALEDLGVGYSQEVAIPGWQGPCDFVVPNERLVIEVDEPYWHDKVADRDARKDAILRAAGYRVLRVVATPYYGEYQPAMATRLHDDLVGTGYVLADQLSMPLGG